MKGQAKGDEFTWVRDDVLAALRTRRAASLGLNTEAARLEVMQCDDLIRHIERYMPHRVRACAHRDGVDGDPGPLTLAALKEWGA